MIIVRSWIAPGRPSSILIHYLMESMIIECSSMCFYRRQCYVLFKGRDQVINKCTAFFRITVPAALKSPINKLLYIPQKKK